VTNSESRKKIISEESTATSTEDEGIVSQRLRDLGYK
jgi:hypothetical protein